MKLKCAHLIWDPNLLALGAQIIVKDSTVLGGKKTTLLTSTKPQPYKTYMKLKFSHLIWDPNLLAPGANILVKTHWCVGQGNPAHKHKATLIQNLHETEMCASYLGP